MIRAKFHRLLVLLFCATFSFLAPAARAQYFYSAPSVTSVNGCTGVCTLASALYPGAPFTVATLPTCNTAAQGQAAYVTDLGGGADNVVCASGYWKHIRLGIPTTNSSNGTITLTALSSAPIQILNNTSLSLGSNINITGSNLYPSELFYVKTPSTLGGLLSSLGVNLNGVSTGLTAVAATTYLYAISSTGTLVQLQP